VVDGYCTSALQAKSAPCTGCGRTPAWEAHAGCPAQTVHGSASHVPRATSSGGWLLHQCSSGKICPMYRMWQDPCMGSPCRMPCPDCPWQCIPRAPCPPHVGRLGNPQAEGCQAAGVAHMHGCSMLAACSQAACGKMRAFLAQNSMRPKCVNMRQ
jgi:hypothetical protein